MFGFNNTPLNSNYGQVLSTPGQGNNFGFGNQAVQSNNPWVSTYDQLINNANTGAVMPAAGQQASVASQQVDPTFDQTVQNYLQEFPAGSQQGAATAEAQPAAAQQAVAQQVAAQPDLTNAVWTGENSSGDVIAATQYNQDPYANLPEEVLEAIKANPGVAQGLISNYRESLQPYWQRNASDDDPYATRAGFGFGPY